MVQNVRGQTLIDAIVQVFQESPGARPLTAAEVARQLRERGFWGGKEPKAPEQVVESYLGGKHGEMFQPTSGGAFALKPVYFRPAARAAAVAAMSSATAAAPARASAASHRPAATIAAAKPVAAVPVAPTGVKAQSKKKRRKLFGRASVAYFAPRGLERDASFERLDVHLSFDQALKLHAGLGQLLAKLEGGSRDGRGRREAVAAMRVHLAKHQITLYARPRKRRATRDYPPMRPAANWGVEPG
ncbi:MAG TPA: hypothetical protein VGI81_12365 [Tepidisphaeraceae bacterium]|jgi:hypothetical protein